MQRANKNILKTYMTKDKIALKTLTKSNVWDVQENDLFRMFTQAEKDAEVKDNIRYYVNMAKVAFDIEEIDGTKEIFRTKYEKMGYKVADIKTDAEHTITLALKKRPITRVTDLTYENIRHISAAKLIEVLERNFGGGWDSLSQSTKDIIESGFDISTTTLPVDRLHKKGGMYEKKVEDGYEVLEVPKGGWVEAIFAKLKPEMEKPRMSFASSSDSSSDDEDDNLPEDNYNSHDDDDDEIQEPSEFEDDDDMTEDNYRTTFSISDDDDEDGGGTIEDYGDEE